MMIRLNIQGNNTAPVITATAAPETCGGSNGTGSVTVTGGTPPYTYLWSSGQSTSAVTGLAAGVYTITISHAGCSRLATDTVKGPTALAVSTAPGAGSATATPSGGMPTYSYSWNTTPAQTTPTATGLAAGTYTVCVTDVNSCTACNTVTVTNGASVNEMYNGASISISPNPFNSITHVKIDLVNPAHGHLMFMVYDMFGREIQAVDMSTYSTSGGTIDFTLNRESIATGMYFYQLKDNSHVLSTGKLIAQ
jgi:hypothetical protein